MKTFFAAAFAALFVSAAPASAADLLGDFKDHLSNNWDQSKRAFSDGDWSLYVTGFTWHMPYAYDDARRRSENAEAWGGGVGRYVYDGNGNYHGLYAIAFRDSHYRPEYQAGYNWQHYWGGEDLKVGFGYTVFVFARADVLDYTPLPGILPLASVRYSRFEVMGTFVPGVGSKGNIAFFFGRFDF
jgi:palmitoyl transferase